MNAVEDNASAASLTNAVSNFGTAYAAMQESLHNNNTSINAMQGQIQMLCNAIGNQPPTGMLQYPQQNYQDCQAPSSQHGQQQNQGQQGQPIGGGCSTNNAGGGRMAGMHLLLLLCMPATLPVSARVFKYRLSIFRGQDSAGI
jgi:hypothetical protein